MALNAGTRLGPFEIVSALGAGGMGEVYRATDTTLKRQVAIKVLPASVAGDPDRLARFQREAEVLAALNHPNIAQIHGLEKSDGTLALVMELVEGPTLADRLAQGAILLADALAIARQIAEALEAAHDQGIVHRDLKPANIKVREDGTVKVLDFGLAKALDPASASGADAANSPTLTVRGTQMGIILGTAAYMAPEQARGRAVDRRADIWAFGVVLFEMLTGTRAFDAEDVSATLAFVITKDPDWAALPATTPTAVRKLLRRCLEKDPRRRLQAIGDARLEIDEMLSAPAVAPGPAATSSSPSRRIAPIVVGAVLGSALLATATTWVAVRRAPEPPPSLTRFAIVPAAARPLGMSGFDRDIAISPDGRSVVYRTGSSGGGGIGQLAMRRLDQLDAHELTGLSVRNPFFSPDGRWIGFFDLDSREVKKVSITGGPAIRVCSTTPGSRGASWGDDDTIVFATNASAGLMRVPAGGGEPQSLTKIDAAQHETGHYFPSMLPGGRGVLFTIASDQPGNAQVAVLDLKSGTRKVLVRGGSHAEYVETSAGSRQPGYLVYASAGTLSAVRFNLARLEVIGDPVPVVDHVMTSSGGAANFAIARNGTLAYVPGGAGVEATARQLVWVDRKGREEPIKAPPRAYAVPRISPDGTRVALDIRDQDLDIWTLDLARQRLTRLTFDPGTDLVPLWAPDSGRIFFASTRTGSINLFWHAADGPGTDQRLTTSVNSQYPGSVTPDGRHLVGSEAFPKTNLDVVQFAMDDPSPGSPAEPLVHTASVERNPEVSPDGRYLAYESNEYGRVEVFVRPYPKVDDGRWQVSSGGGTRPVWARSGRELFFLDGSNALMSAPVQATGGTFTTATPAKVFDAKYATPTVFRSYDVSPDGRRFLMIKESAADANAPPPSLVVVEHWVEELKAKLPNR